MKKHLQSISKNAILLNPDAFTAAEKQAQWIGKTPATDVEIAAAETRIGIKLPQDVVDFYKTSNGTSEILSHTFSGFMPLESIGWLNELIPETVENYAGISEEYGNALKNSIIIAGVNHVHNILLIQPFGAHKNWRYWEFAHYIPGENAFEGIGNYLERIDDFLKTQVINKPL